MYDLFFIYFWTGHLDENLIQCLIDENLFQCLTDKDLSLKNLWPVGKPHYANIMLMFILICILPKKFHIRILYFLADGSSQPSSRNLFAPLYRHDSRFYGVSEGQGNLSLGDWYYRLRYCSNISLVLFTDPTIAWHL